MVKEEVGRGDLPGKRSRERETQGLQTEGCCTSLFGRRVFHFIPRHQRSTLSLNLRRDLKVKVVNPPLPPPPRLGGVHLNQRYNTKRNEQRAADFAALGGFPSSVRTQSIAGR